MVFAQIATIDQVTDKIRDATESRETAYDDAPYSVPAGAQASL